MICGCGAWAPLQPPLFWARACRWTAWHPLGIVGTARLDDVRVRAHRAASSLLFISSHCVCLPCMRVRTRCHFAVQLFSMQQEFEMALAEALAGSMTAPRCLCPRCRRDRRRTRPWECRPRTWHRRWGDLRLRPRAACHPDRAKGPWAPPSCAVCLATRAGNPNAAGARRASAPRK